MVNFTKPTNKNLDLIAQHNINKWIEALNTKDASIVAALYADDSTFLPTISGDLKKGVAGAELYFRHFLAKSPRCVIKENVVQQLSANSYLHTGMYNFEIGPTNKRQFMEARFSFVWAKQPDNAYLIIHHHSSLKPTV